MHIGSYLPAGANVLSSWFERGGDNAIFTAEVVDTLGGGSLTVTIWHKNKDEIGPGTEITTEWTTVHTSFKYHQEDGLKELVRFEYTIDGEWGDGVIYRMLQPTWFDRRNV